MPVPNQTVSLTSAAASVDTSTYTMVVQSVGNEAPTGARDLGHQAVRVSGSFSNGSTDTATVRFVLRGARSTSSIVSSVTLTGAANARRMGQNGASGGYEAVFDGDPKKCYVDLHGAGIGQDGDQYRWYVGASAVSAGTLTLYLEPTRAI